MLKDRHTGGGGGEKDTNKKHIHTRIEVMKEKAFLCNFQNVLNSNRCGQNQQNIEEHIYYLRVEWSQHSQCASHK